MSTVALFTFGIVCFAVGMYGLGFATGLVWQGSGRVPKAPEGSE